MEATIVEWSGSLCSACGYVGVEMPDRALFDRCRRQFNEQSLTFLGPMDKLLKNQSNSPSMIQEKLNLQFIAVENTINLINF